MKNARIEWGKEHKKKSLKFWRSVLFSDETTISINLSSVMNRIRRLPGSNPFHEKYLNPTVKRPLHIMFWGSFGYNGAGSLIPIECYMDGTKYIQLLDSVLIKDMQKLKCKIF